MYLNNGGSVSSSDYVGVYAIMEVIEEDGDRVNVGKLSTGAGGLPVEGGFIWKNDRGSAYVDPDTPTSAQRVYMDGCSVIFELLPRDRIHETRSEATHATPMSTRSSTTTF